LNALLPYLFAADSSPFPSEGSSIKAKTIIISRFHHDFPIFSAATLAEAQQSELSVKVSSSLID
jgi:hypothetical protein